MDGGQDCVTPYSKYTGTLLKRLAYDKSIQRQSKALFSQGGNIMSFGLLLCIKLTCHSFSLLEPLFVTVSLNEQKIV